MGGRATLLAAAVLASLSPSAALAQILPDVGQKPANPFCLKLGEETPEIYGPTDIGATVGNQRLSVAVNPRGTLSVLRWPSPSYYDQLKYFTIDRDLPLLGLEPNEGAFSGLELRLRGDRRRLVWLRDLDARQRYASDDSDTIVTRFASKRLGLDLELADVVPPDADVLMRRHVLRLDRRSPVRRARLIVLANLNPTASKRLFLPTEDWCEEADGTDRARYSRERDAVIYDITEPDLSTGATESVAIAIGADRRSAEHQIGADHYAARRSRQAGEPPSAYDDAADGRLAGNDRLLGEEVDAALSLPFRTGALTVTFAAASHPRGATRLLREYRARDVTREAERKRRDHLRWLARAPLPKGAPPAVVRLARRALVSLRQAIDETAGPRGDTAAIVASIATQSPYGEDWIRDGAFFNEALDEIGHHRLVERHNQFYADVQETAEEGAPPGSPASACEQPTPDGNWFMNNYADGGESAPITWEIDETAYGLWTLWRHYERADGGRRAQLAAYLDRVYPTIRRAADFLVAFRDPVSLLPPGTACEDDEPPQPGQPTMHSAGPVLLAMRSAVDAAAESGHAGDERRYRRRVRELEGAIDRRYRVAGGAWTEDFEDGGWALWPVRVKRDFGDPRMRAQADAVWAAVRPSFDAPAGSRGRDQYEQKALHGLAHYHRHVASRGMDRVRRGLRWIAEVQARYQDTGILGEAWYVRGGRVVSVVSQPHVWGQVLFYLAALEAYGRESWEAADARRPLRSVAEPHRTR